MKFNNREFFRLSFIYTAVAALPPFLNLFVRPFIEGEGKLQPADFSQIEITEVITSLAFIMATFAMNNAISRFYYDHNENPRNLNKLISGIFSSILMRGVVIFAVALAAQSYIGKIFTQPELQDFSRYGFVALLVGLFRAINTTAFALYRNEKRVRRYLTLGFLLGLLRSVFQLVGVLYFDMSFIGYLYGSAIGSGLISVIILFYVYSRSGIHFDWSILHPANRFAVPLFEYSILAWGISFADRYFLESSPDVLGIYSQALLLGKGIEIIIQGMQGAFQPEIFRMMKMGIDGNLEDIKRLSHLMMAQTQLLIAAAILPAMVYCLIFKTELRFASGFISIVFIQYILRTQYNIFSMPVYYQKKTKLFLYLNIVVLAVNLTLLYFLVPLWKAHGAITALLISLTVQTIGIYLIQRRVAPINWNLNKLLSFPLLIVFITAITEILKIRYNLEPFITSAFVVLAILFSLFFLYRNEVRGVIVSLRKRYQI
jgi:O-antigen/teichoic acid export membrane protein